MTLAHREIVQLSQQSTLGTSVTPTHLMPVTSVSISEHFEQILDNGRRGADSMDYQAVQGVKHVEVSLEGQVMPHGTTGMPFGLLLRNLLGSGTATSSYPSPIQIGATGVYKHYRFLGTTKEYLTLEHASLQSSNDREVEGCRCHSITLSWNAGEGALNFSADLVGRDVTLVTVADLSAQITTPENPFSGWRASVNVNGSTNTRLISAEWTLSREVHRTYTGQNSQLYNDILLGPLEVTCSLVFDYSVVTDLALFRAKTQGELLNLFEYGSSGTLRGFGIASFLTDFGDGAAEIDSSAVNNTLALTARCLHSTSDGPIGTDKSDSNAQNGPIETISEETASARY